jgi:DMSO reductase family type II enzyme chaperone
MNAGVYQDANAALQRAGLYLVLAQAFAYPKAETLAPVAGRWARLLEAENQWPDYLRQAVEAGCAELRSAEVAALAAEYHRLFGPNALCPLTETSWGDAARLLGKAAQIADIAGFYRAFHLRPLDEGDPVPEDHLLSELEFMSVLCLKEAYALYAELDEALEITRGAQKKFLEDHLAAWIDVWAKHLGEHDPATFYRALATTLRSLMRSEVERLQLKPAQIVARAEDHVAGGDAFICPHADEP